MAVMNRNCGAHLLAPLVVLEVHSQKAPHRRVEVDGDGFLIGRGDFCDLQLDGEDQPLVHSELHLQGGSVWIEAADETILLSVNGRLCRRIALREGDRLDIGSTEVIVHLGTPAEGANPLPRLTPAAEEDLSLLTASELCDRIAAEQAEVDAFQQQQRSGYRSLLQAVESVLHDGTHAEGEPRWTAAVSQLRALIEQLSTDAGQPGVPFVDSTAELPETQEGVSRRIEELLRSFADGDLRASA